MRVSSAWKRWQALRESETAQTPLGQWGATCKTLSGDEGCGLDQPFDSRALKVSCFPNSGHLIGGFEFLLFGGPELEMASENFIDIRGRETLIGEISLDIDPVDSGNVSKLINGKAAFFDVFS